MGEVFPSVPAEVLEANREGRLHPRQRHELLREARMFAGILAGIGVADVVSALASRGPAAFVVPSVVVLGAGPVLLAAGLPRWYRRRLDDPVTMLRGPLTATQAGREKVYLGVHGHLVSTDPDLAGAHAEVAVWHRRTMAATLLGEPPRGASCCPGRPADEQ